jgi:hypothetical protein
MVALFYFRSGLHLVRRHLQEERTRHPRGPLYRQHKRQKLKLVVVPRTWSELSQRIWRTPHEGASTVGALASSASVMVAVVTLLFRSERPND